MDSGRAMLRYASPASAPGGVQYRTLRQARATFNHLAWGRLTQLKEFCSEVPHQVATAPLLQEREGWRRASSAHSRILRLQGDGPRRHVGDASHLRQIRRTLLVGPRPAQGVRRKQDHERPTPLKKSPRLRSQRAYAGDRPSCRRRGCGASPGAQGAEARAAGQPHAKAVRRPGRYDHPIRGRETESRRHRFASQATRRGRPRRIRRLLRARQRGRSRDSGARPAIRRHSRAARRKRARRTGIHRVPSPARPRRHRRGFRRSRPAQAARPAARQAGGRRAAATGAALARSPRPARAARRSRRLRRLAGLPRSRRAVVHRRHRTGQARRRGADRHLQLAPLRAAVPHPASARHAGRPPLRGAGRRCACDVRQHFGGHAADHPRPHPVPGALRHRHAAGGDGCLRGDRRAALFRRPRLAGGALARRRASGWSASARWPRWPA